MSYTEKLKLEADTAYVFGFLGIFELFKSNVVAMNAIFIIVYKYASYLCAQYHDQCNERMGGCNR